MFGGVGAVTVNKIVDLKIFFLEIFFLPLFILLSSFSLIRNRIQELSLNDSFVSYQNSTKSWFVSNAGAALGFKIHGAKGNKMA